MPALSETADQQALWSKTADALKKNIDWARGAIFILSVSGALLATIASQLDDMQGRVPVGIAGAVCLAIMSFLASRFLGGTQTRNWIRCRAASEALKREAYKYAAAAAPYDNTGTRETLLNAERTRIEGDFADLTALQVPGKHTGSAPRDALAHDQYIAKRVQGQIDWYRKKADRHLASAKNLRRIELALSLAATIITAAVGIVGKEALGFLGIMFDFVALTAVLTTVAGAVLAHIEASRYDFLVTTYRATARRLSNELASLKDSPAQLEANWSAFVGRCEAILAEENNNWIAKWTSGAQ